MSRLADSVHLSQVDTLWSVVGRAHGTAEEHSVRGAQQELLNRYLPVVNKYLRGAVRDADAASELLQDFALRFIRGDFRSADAQRGRFRDFLKGVLIHLIADHFRRLQRSDKQLPEPLEPSVADPPPESDVEARFIHDWRNELLLRSWQALADYETTHGQPWYALLKLRSEQADLRSVDLAERFSAKIGKPVSADWVRQNLHRAREKFAELLVHDVLQTLDQPTLDQLEQELIDLGIVEYCRPVLRRMQ